MLVTPYDTESHKRQHEEKRCCKRDKSSSSTKGITNISSNSALRCGQFSACTHRGEPCPIRNLIHMINELNYPSPTSMSTAGIAVLPNRVEATKSHNKVAWTCITWRDLHGSLANFESMCRLWQTRELSLYSRSSSYILCLQWLPCEGRKTLTHKNCGEMQHHQYFGELATAAYCFLAQLNKLQFVVARNANLPSLYYRYFFSCDIYITWKFGVIILLLRWLWIKGTLCSVQKKCCLHHEETSLGLKSCAGVPFGNSAIQIQGPKLSSWPTSHTYVLSIWPL